MGAQGDFVSSLIFAGLKYPDREIEILGLLYYGGILTDGFVTAVHVAVQAACACPGAAVPQIPVDGYRRTGINIIFR